MPYAGSSCGAHSLGLSVVACSGRELLEPDFAKPVGPRCETDSQGRMICYDPSLSMTTLNLDPG